MTTLQLYPPFAVFCLLYASCHLPHLSPLAVCLLFLTVILYSTGHFCLYIKWNILVSSVDLGFTWRREAPIPPAGIINYLDKSCGSGTVGALTAKLVGWVASVEYLVSSRVWPWGHVPKGLRGCNITSSVVLVNYNQNWKYYSKAKSLYINLLVRHNLLSLN